MRFATRIAAATAVAVSASAAFAASASAAAGAAASASTEVRQITWSDLLPKDWKPPPPPQIRGIFSDATPEAHDAMAEMRAIWDAAPTVDEMNGTLVKIPGYVVPLEETKAGMTEFLLVPYFGACIHSPPPPANQIAFVRAKVPAKGFRAMDTVWVTGRLVTVRQSSFMGTSGYRIEAGSVEKFLVTNVP